MVCHLRPLPLGSRPSSRASWCGCPHLCRAGGEERTAEPQGVLEKARSPLHRALHAGDARGLCPAPLNMTRAGLPRRRDVPTLSAPSVELTCFPASSYHPFPQRVRAPSPGSPGTQLCLRSTRLPSREACSGSLPGTGPGSPRGAPLWVPARFFTRTLPDRTGLLQVQPVISHKHVGQV